MESLHAMRILAAIPLSEQQRARIEAAAPGCRLVCRAKEEISTDDLRDAQIIFGPLSPETLKNAPALQWVQLSTAGADPYTKPGALDQAIRLTSSVGAYGLTVSEHMLAMLMSMNRNLPQYYQAQARGKWQPGGPVRSVEGAVILVLGLGNIGGDFARKVKALGAYTIGVKRAPAARPDFMDEMAVLSDLDALLPRADVVAICLPLTENTKGMFNAARFARMKPEAILLNIGRGAIVDTDALLAALEEGRLGGACLDVTDPEPLPDGHPLWHQERALITPHVAGHFHLAETKNRVVDIFCDNLRRYQAGEPLRNPVPHG